MIVYIACPIDLAMGEQSLPAWAAKQLTERGIGVYRPWEAFDVVGIRDDDLRVRRMNLGALVESSAVLCFLTRTMSWGSVIDVETALAYDIPVIMHVDPEIDRIPLYIDQEKVAISTDLGICLDYLGDLWRKPNE